LQRAVSIRWTDRDYARTSIPIPAASEPAGSSVLLRHFAIGLLRQNGRTSAVIADNVGVADQGRIVVPTVETDGTSEELVRPLWLMFAPVARQPKTTRVAERGVRWSVDSERHWTDGVGLLVGGATGERVAASDSPPTSPALEQPPDSVGEARRYEVVFGCMPARNPQDSPLFSDFRYLVATRFGTNKAVLIAAIAHGAEHPTEHVVTVEVADRGALKPSPDRVTVFELNDIGDLWEW
jgi:hypothetical protein